MKVGPNMQFEGHQTPDLLSGSFFQTRCSKNPRSGSLTKMLKLGSRSRKHPRLGFHVPSPLGLQPPPEKMVGVGFGGLTTF